MTIPNWAVEHKADLAGVALGIVVGVGCTAITGGAGVVVCGAIGGALSSGLTGLMKGERGMDLAISFGSGALLGAAGGALGSLSGAATVGVSSGKEAGKEALKQAGGALVSGFKDSARAFSRKGFGEFVETSKVNIAYEAIKLGSRERQQLAIATDVIAGAVSPRSGIVPAAVAGALPGNWNDVQDIMQEGWKFKPENMLGPLSGGGLGAGR